MQEITFAIGEFWSGLGSIIATAGVVDVFDILVVTYLLYNAIKLVRETRALQLAKGVAVVLIVYLTASTLGMITLTAIITNIVNWGILAIAILFQPEIRSALEKVGRSRISTISRFTGGREGGEFTAAIQKMIGVVCESSRLLAADKTGALMVIERETKLGDVISSGTLIDSEPSVALLCNIFYPNTPMHDGAMILREGRVYAAGCFLPLSANDQIGRELGTRHRAALGMSEASDAIVVVVSEESGKISVAVDGRLRRDYSVAQLAALLESGLNPNPEESKIKPFWRKS